MIECTAWEIVGKYAPLVDTSHVIRLAGGRVEYEDAYPARGDVSICVQRITIESGLRAVRRYLTPETRVELVPLKDERFRERWESYWRYVDDTNTRALESGDYKLTPMSYDRWAGREYARYDIETQQHL